MANQPESLVKITTSQKPSEVQKKSAQSLELMEMNPDGSWSDVYQQPDGVHGIQAVQGYPQGDIGIVLEDVVSPQYGEASIEARATNDPDFDKDASKKLP